MDSSIENILALYDQEAPLEMAYTIPAAWYVDERIAHLENQQVFGGNWIAVGRTDQVAAAGQFFTFDLAGEPLVIVRGTDNKLRAFFNVCRHHAAAVATAPCGVAQLLRCPYHGWTMVWTVRSKEHPSSPVFAILTVLRTGCCPCAWKPGRTLSS